MSRDRDTEADEVELIPDPLKRAERESENGLRQYKLAEEIIRSSLNSPDFKLTQKIIRDLHEEALRGIHRLAGTYRNSYVRISESRHVPPHYSEVADHVAELTNYVNTHWLDRNAIQLASYVMWRLNWIHPFADGNGRTARTLSYLVLSAKLNSFLPGSPTIPYLIDADKDPYYSALETADELLRLNGTESVATMELYIESLLEVQLKSALVQAGL